MLKQGINRERLMESVKEWLRSRGDRNLNDLRTDKEGYYFVWMGAGDGTLIESYLPDYLQN